MRLIILNAIDVKFEREVVVAQDEDSVIVYSQDLPWELIAYDANFMTI